MSDTYDCSHLDDASLRRLAAIERKQAQPDPRYAGELRRRMRNREIDNMRQKHYSGDPMSDYLTQRLEIDARFLARTVLDRLGRSL